MKFSIVEKLGPKVGRAMMKGKQVAPDVAIVGGLAAVVIGGVWLGKRTYDASCEIKKSKAKIENIKEAMVMEGADVPKAKEMLKDERKAFFKKMLKTYGLPLAMIVCGGTAVICGHREIKIRNASLGTALTAELMRNKNMAEFIDEKHGEGVSDKVSRGIKEQAVTYKNEEGKKEKDIIDILEQDKYHGIFTMLFDSASYKFSKDPSLNKMALREVENELIRDYNRGIPVSVYRAFITAGFSKDFLTGRLSKEVLDMSKRCVWMEGITPPPCLGIYSVYKSENESFIQGYTPECIFEPVGVSYSYMI